VAEAAVVGANDATTGQAIVGYVILRGGNPSSPELAEEIRQHVATKLGEPVVLAPFVVLERSSVLGVGHAFDEPFVEQALEHGVEGAGTDAHHAVSPVRDLANDAVAMAVGVGQSDQNLGGERRQGQKAAWVSHEDLTLMQ
jgi:hypothetical protein